MKRLHPWILISNFKGISGISKYTQASWGLNLCAWCHCWSACRFFLNYYGNAHGLTCGCGCRRCSCGSCYLGGGTGCGCRSPGRGSTRLWVLQLDKSAESCKLYTLKPLPIISYIILKHPDPSCKLYTFKTYHKFSSHSWMWEGRSLCSGP